MLLKHSEIIGSKDSNCVLVAFKNTCSWLDEQHIIDVGVSNKFYDPQFGVLHVLMEKYMDYLGILYKRVPKKEMNTIHRFAKEHPTGVYLLQVHGHALVLNNGKIWDPNLQNYGIQRPVENAHLILNSDLEPEDTTWDQMTKFHLVVLNFKGAGTGLRKGSKNHKALSDLQFHVRAIDKFFSFQEIKTKYGISMETFIYFIERGIIRKA